MFYCAAIKYTDKHIQFLKTITLTILLRSISFLTEDKYYQQLYIFYHTCYEVSDFKEGIELFKDKGFRAMTKPFLTELENEEYHCKWATHMYHPKLGMIELYGKEYNNE